MRLPRVSLSWSRDTSPTKRADSNVSRLFARLRGSYDAAITNEGNRRHWAFADGMSADAAASPEVRRVLRTRARYECANNCYARGMSLTIANDTIGEGPRLQMLTDDNELNETVEREFARWCKAANIPQKLRAMRVARIESGEVFGVLGNNPEIDAPVQLDLRLVEADQVQTPDLSALDASKVDGIVFDEWGNPAEYHVLKTHPGDRLATTDYDRITAKNVIHYFRADRPGQSRGVPEITPAIPLFALLRRYTLASVAAAEAAADIAGILRTNNTPDEGADEVEPGDVFSLESRMLMVAPAGWQMEQMRAEHPTTTYAEFKREILNEIARCLNVPFNIAAGNSASYNYASGRLDFQTYDFAIRIDRKDIEHVVLDRLLSEFLREAVLVSGLLPLRARTLLSTGSGASRTSHKWFWGARAHVDPTKEATAQAQRLRSHTTTLASEYALAGRDWESELRQRAREIELAKQLGLPLENVAGGTPANADTERDEEEAEHAGE